MPSRRASTATAVSSPFSGRCTAPNESTSPAATTVATLAARNYLDEEDDLAGKLRRAWCPYHSDGSPLGVALWDAWAARTLGHESAPEERAD